MTRFFVGLSMVLVAVCAGVFGVRVLPNTSHPPNAVPPVAEVAIGPLPLELHGAVYPGEVITQVGAWVEGELRHEQEQAAAEAERLRAAQQTANQSVARPGAQSAGECAGVDWVIPVGLVVRESKCNFDAQSPASFCGGYGCVGAYQFDARHWDPGSWGGCADLGDWHDPEAQHECARRLSSGGTNLAPWGG